MSASSSASKSAHWCREPMIHAIEPDNAVRSTLGFVFLYIAVPRRDLSSAHCRFRERRGAARLLILAAHNELRKELSIRTQADNAPENVCQGTPNPKRGWINAVVWTLLAGCCAVTLFFAFQAPFRLRANENLANSVKLRSEIAALPAGLETQTMSRFRHSASQQGGGYDKEVVSSSVSDSRHRRMPIREGLVQHKQPRVCVQSGLFSDRR